MAKSRLGIRHSPGYNHITTPPPAAPRREEAESWVITKALVLNKATPDKGKPIKNMAANALAYHYYIYANAGNYTATFEVSNTTVYESKTSVKEVPVTITP